MTCEVAGRVLAHSSDLCVCDRFPLSVDVGMVVCLSLVSPRVSSDRLHQLRMSGVEKGWMDDDDLHVNI